MMCTGDLDGWSGLAAGGARWGRIVLRRLSGELRALFSSLSEHLMFTVLYFMQPFGLSCLSRQKDKDYSPSGEIGNEMRKNRKRLSGTVRQDTSKTITEILKIRKICSTVFNATTILSVNWVLYYILFNYTMQFSSRYNERATEDRLPQFGLRCMFLMSCWHVDTSCVSNCVAYTQYVLKLSRETASTAVWFLEG